MWSLCLALDAPERVRSVVSIGMPAVAVPGIHGDPFFTLLTIPGVGRVASRIVPAPRGATIVRRSMKDVMGQPVLDAMPDAFFDVVSAGMRMPGWRQAMWTHLNLALRSGRERPGNSLTDDELRAIEAPVVLVWGDEDVYGGPELGRRAAELMPHARLEVVPGNHAPFLDDPARCAAIVEEVRQRD
jgi:pimeloyl-ACP methyl ester carboxylesterase